MPAQIRSPIETKPAAGVLQRGERVQLADAPPFGRKPERVVAKRTQDRDATQFGLTLVEPELIRCMIEVLVLIAVRAVQRHQ